MTTIPELLERLDRKGTVRPSIRLYDALPELAAYVRALEDRLNVVRSNAGMCVYNHDEKFRAGSAEAFNQAAEQANSEEVDQARAALAAKLTNEGSSK